MKIIPVNEKGSDVPPTKDGKYDAHVRIEEYEGLRQIFVDVYNFQIKDADRAHIESAGFPPNLEGINEATDFLKGYGFDVQLIGMVPRR